MYVLVQGMKVPVEQQFKSCARICKAFDINIDPNWTLQTVMKLFRRSVKSFRHPIDNASTCKAIYMRGFPLCFQQYDILTLINLLSDFDTTNANFYVDMYENDGSSSTGSCLIRFMNSKFCIQVFRDLRNLHVYDKNIKVSLDYGNHISLDKDNESPYMKKNAKLNKMVRQAIVRQHKQMSKCGYKEDYSDVEMEFEEHKKYVKSEAKASASKICKQMDTTGSHSENVVKPTAVNKSEIQPSNVKTQNVVKTIKTKAHNTEVERETTYKTNKVVPQTVGVQKENIDESIMIVTKYDAVSTVTQSDKVSSKVKEDEKCTVVSFKNFPKCDRIFVIRKMITANFPDLRYRIYELKADSKFTGEHLLQFPTHESAVLVCTKLNGALFKNSHIIVELAVGRVFPEIGSLSDTVPNWKAAQDVLKATHPGSVPAPQSRPSELKLAIENAPDKQQDIQNMANETKMQLNMEKPCEVFLPPIKVDEPIIVKTPIIVEKPAIVENPITVEKSTFIKMLSAKQTVDEDINCRVVTITNIPTPKVLNIAFIKLMIDYVNPHLRFNLQKAKVGTMLTMTQKSVYLVQFPTPYDAYNVCDKLNGLVFEGKRVSVELAKGRDFPERSKKRVVPDTEITQRFLPKKKQRALERLTEAWKAKFCSRRAPQYENRECVKNYIAPQTSVEGACVEMEKQTDDYIPILVKEDTHAVRIADNSESSVPPAKKDMNISSEMGSDTQQPEHNDSTSSCIVKGPVLTEEPTYDTYGLKLDFLRTHRISLPLRPTVIVKNLHHGVNVDDLYQVFRMAGAIRNINRTYSDSEGLTAKIEFDHPVEAVQAISLFHDQILFDNRMSVQMDTSWESRSWPEGLSLIGKGLGKNGEPLRGVRVIVALDEAKKALVDAGRLDKTLTTDRFAPFKYTYTERENFQADINNTDSNTDITDMPVDSLKDTDGNDSERHDDNDSTLIQILSKILATEGLLPEGTDCNDLDSLLSVLKRNRESRIKTDKNKSNLTNNTGNPNMAAQQNINNTNVSSMFLNMNKMTFGSGQSINTKRRNNDVRLNKGVDLIKRAALLYDDPPMANCNVNQNVSPCSRPNVSDNRSTLPIWAPNVQDFDRNMPQDSNQCSSNSSNSTIDHFDDRNVIPMECDEVELHSKEICRGNINDSISESKQEILKDKEDSSSESKTDMLIFKNLPPCMSSEALGSKLGEVGGVVYCELTGRGRAVVRFHSAGQAERCRQLFHHSKVNGQVIEVTLMQKVA